MKGNDYITNLIISMKKNEKNTNVLGKEEKN